MIKLTDAQVSRIAEVTRREEILRVEFPDLAADFDAFEAEGRRLREAGRDPYYAFRTHRQHAHGHELFQTAAVTDGWWGAENDTAFQSYREYVEYYR